MSFPTLDRAEALRSKRRISGSASGTEVDHSAAVPRAWRSSNCSKPPIARWPRTATSSRCKPGRTTIMPVPLSTSRANSRHSISRCGQHRQGAGLVCLPRGGRRWRLSRSLCRVLRNRFCIGVGWGNPGHSNCCCGRPTSDPVTRSSSRVNTFVAMPKPFCSPGPPGVRRYRRRHGADRSGCGGRSRDRSDAAILPVISTARPSPCHPAEPGGGKGTHADQRACQAHGARRGNAGRKPGRCGRIQFLSQQEPGALGMRAGDDQRPGAGREIENAEGPRVSRTLRA
ncbi:MAG: hypothetical protein Ct9H300mP1_05660 [Planctomycetaceae bacterium]|nr:MAG: hypothetical protein Ct9H300mP1_05660 [Planctomycetaceae bacterium]